MTPEQFCYWLNGFGELTPEPPTPEQWRAIKEHLATVFTKVTPRAPGSLDELNRASRGAPAPAMPQLDPYRAPYALPPYVTDPLRVTC